jgi:hypothetical protein
MPTGQVSLLGLSALSPDDGVVAADDEEEGEI